MDFLTEELDHFITTNTDKEPKILADLNHETWEKVLIPRMLSGHFQGRVLSMISHMIKPTTVLEIGTYTGYSAICLAEGLQKDGKIYTIDINEELESMVNKYIERSDLKDTIINKIGNAIEIIPTIKQKFDLVFIDADKLNYSNYYDLVFDQVNTGGYIIADNVLWSGKVVKSRKNLDPDTIALIDYSEKVTKDDRVQNVLFPIRDGLMVVRKK
jgi:caffeoyl-CoA O-methyltransferase